MLKIKYTSAIQYRVFNVKIKGGDHISKKLPIVPKQSYVMLMPKE